MKALLFALVPLALWGQASSFPGSGGSVAAGSGIAVVGSTVSVDTAVILSRATAQAGTSNYCRSTTGNDTYTCSLTPTLTAYTTGGCLVLNPNASNTLTATVNVDTLGAKSILNRSGAALATGDITADKPITVCYDGTQYIIQGDGGGSPTVTDVYWPYGIAGGTTMSAHNPGVGVQRVWTFTPPYTITTTKFRYQTSGTAYLAWAITAFDGTAAVTNATANCNHTAGSGNALECSWAGSVTLTGGTTYRLVMSGDAATGVYIFTDSGFLGYNNGSNNGFVFSSSRSIGDATATSSGTGATRAIAFPLGTITAVATIAGNGYPGIVFVP